MAKAILNSCRAAISIALLALPSAAAAGVCAADPGGIAASLFSAGGCDSNADDRLSVADVTAAAVELTRPACPGSGSLAVHLQGAAGASPRLRLYGRRLRADCDSDGAAVSYDESVECAIDSTLPCLERDGLAPGRWVHSIEVEEPNTGQRQHRAGLVIAGTAAVLTYTVFATALSVESTANSGSRSLRNRLQASAAAAKPVLIWFDETTFASSVPTTIELASALPALSAGDVTIDGIGANGERGNRIIDAGGGPFGALSITSARNHLIGLRLRGAGANDRDVLNLSGAAAVANLIEQCVVESAASADGIGVDQQAGDSFGPTVNVVRDTEVQAAADKGIKVTTGAHLRVENSWVHHNDNGGVQATLAGNVRVLHSVIEDNRGGSAQNGLSVQAAEAEESAAYMESSGNLVRRNGANGLSVRTAVAVVESSYFSQNGSSGIRIFNDVGPGSLAVVERSTVACNRVDGAVVVNSSTADFGGGPAQSSGDNAFTHNRHDGGFNLRNASGLTLSASNNQWEHCGEAATCDEARIAARDLNDNGRNTLISPAQSHRMPLTPVLEAVAPVSGRAGELVRLFGRGFNVIDGHLPDDRCGDVAAANSCLPLRGNCVRVGGVPAAVEAVTPTMLVIRRPFTCLQPTTVSVTVQRSGGGRTSNALPICSGDQAPDARVKKAAERS